jgi:hypothetical protein
MRRATVNFIVDLAGFGVLLCLAGTGVILHFVLPSGTGGLGRELHGGRGREHIRELLGMGRHDWGDIHLWLGIIFIALMVAHLVLHWKWVKCYIASLFGGGAKQPCEEKLTS